MPIAISTYGVSFMAFGDKLSVALDENITRAHIKGKNVFELHAPNVDGSQSPTIDMTPATEETPGVKTYSFVDDISTLEVLPGMEELIRLVGVGFPGMTIHAIDINVCEKESGPDTAWEKHNKYKHDNTDIDMIVAVELQSDSASLHSSLQLCGFEECFFRNKSGSAMFFPSGSVHRIMFRPSTTIIRFYLSGARTHTFSKKLQAAFYKAVIGDLPASVLTDLSAANTSPEIDSLLEAPLYRDTAQTTMSLSEMLLEDASRTLNGGAGTPIAQKETRAVDAMSSMWCKSPPPVSSGSTRLRRSGASASKLSPHQQGLPFLPKAMLKTTGSVSASVSGRAKSAVNYNEDEQEEDDDEVSSIVPTSPKKSASPKSATMDPPAAEQCPRHPYCTKPKKHRGNCCIVHPTTARPTIAANPTVAALADVAPTPTDTALVDDAVSAPTDDEAPAPAEAAPTATESSGMRKRKQKQWEPEINEKVYVYNPLSHPTNPGMLRNGVVKKKSSVNYIVEMVDFEDCDCPANSGCSCPREHESVNKSRVQRGEDALPEYSRQDFEASLKIGTPVQIFPPNAHAWYRVIIAGIKGKHVKSYTVRSDIYPTANDGKPCKIADLRPSFVYVKETATWEIEEE